MHNQSDHEQQAILAGLAAAAAMMTIAIAFALASGCKARDADHEQPAAVAEEQAYGGGAPFVDNLLHVDMP